MCVLAGPTFLIEPRLRAEPRPETQELVPLTVVIAGAAVGGAAGCWLASGLTPE
jgi:hypothetical protein